MNTKHVAENVLSNDELINVLIAEKVFGWTLWSSLKYKKARTPEEYKDALVNDGWYWKTENKKMRFYGEAWQWRPTTNILNAKKIQDYLASKGFYLTISDNRHKLYSEDGEEPFCCFWTHISKAEQGEECPTALHDLGAKTEAMVICKAAVWLGENNEL